MSLLANLVKLQEIDSVFDIFLVELYKWLPIPPDSNMIDSQEYQDSILNDIIKSHADEKQRAAQFFDERKNELMQGNLEPNDQVSSVTEIQESIEKNVQIEVSEPEQEILESLEKDEPTTESVAEEV